MTKYFWVDPSLLNGTFFVDFVFVLNFIIIFSFVCIMYTLTQVCHNVCFTFDGEGLSLAERRWSSECVWTGARTRAFSSPTVTPIAVQINPVTESKMEKQSRLFSRQCQSHMLEPARLQPWRLQLVKSKPSCHESKRKQGRIHDSISRVRVGRGTNAV